MSAFRVAGNRGEHGTGHAPGQGLGMKLGMGLGMWLGMTMGDQNNMAMHLKKKICCNQQPPLQKRATPKIFFSENYAPFKIIHLPNVTHFFTL